MIPSNKTSAGSGCCKCLPAPHNFNIAQNSWVNAMLLSLSWLLHPLNCLLGGHVISGTFLDFNLKQQARVCFVTMIHLCLIKDLEKLSNKSSSFRLQIQEICLTVSLQHISTHLATLLPATMMPSDVWHMGHCVRKAPSCPAKLLPSAGTQRGSSPFLDWQLSRVKYHFYLHFHSLREGRLTVFRWRLVDVWPFT